MQEWKFLHSSRKKDAIALNKKIGLKLTCMGPELCKAGFPVSAFEIELDNKKYNKNKSI